MAEIRVVLDTNVLFEGLTVYSVQIMPEEAAAQHEAAYLALRQQWGKTSPAQVAEVLAKREAVEPEPELKPEAFERLRQRIEAK